MIDRNELDRLREQLDVSRKERDEAVYCHPSGCCNEQQGPCRGWKQREGERDWKQENERLRADLSKAVGHVQQLLKESEQARTTPVAVEADQWLMEHEKVESGH